MFSTNYFTNRPALEIARARLARAPLAPAGRLPLDLVVRSNVGEAGNVDRHPPGRVLEFENVDVVHRILPRERGPRQIGEPLVNICGLVMVRVVAQLRDAREMVVAPIVAMEPDPLPHAVGTRGLRRFPLVGLVVGAARRFRHRVQVASAGAGCRRRVPAPGAGAGCRRRVPAPGRRRVPAPGQGAGTVRRPHLRRTCNAL